MSARPAERSFTSRVPLAWPTLALAAGVVVLWFGASLGVVFGLLPLWLGVVLNTLAAFAAFTVMHDASHKSLAEASWLNELLGRLLGLFLLAPFGAFRWVHLTHHRHTNDPIQDPDFWSGAGPRWLLPFRWLTQDLHYYALYVRAFSARPKGERREVVVVMVGFLMLVLVLGSWGLPVVWLWLLPARLAIMMLAFSFDYLPHRPHQILASDDRYRATSLFGDRFLTPFLLYQNYHLIHHLFPAVPFYRYGKVWRAKQEELLAKGVKVEYLFK